MGRWFGNPARVYGPELIFEELEERIVLDASLDPAFQDSLHQLNVILASSERLDLPALATAAAGKAELVLYDHQDNLRTIETKLEDLAQTTGRKIAVVAVVEHGSPGELTIGNERIDVSNVDAHRSDFQALSRALSEHAQIQLYGCSVAENAAGKALVDRIAAYTSADVFASTDTTGGKTGNWLLEYASDQTVSSIGIFDAAPLVNVGPLAPPQAIADVLAYCSFVEMNGKVYFAGYEGIHCSELWVYDPVAGTSSMVKDIMPGLGCGVIDLEGLKKIGDVLYFWGDDGTNGRELWKSDGTAGGTVMVKDINPGSGSSEPWFFTNVNGTLYFEADDGTHGYELWKSNGTAGGTVMVKDIKSGSGSSEPSYLTNVNGTLYFKAYDGTHGEELWTSDGTAGGTVMVKDINPSYAHSSPSLLTNFSGVLYFTADDGTHGYELWKSDGTAGGTVMVKDINPGSGRSVPWYFTNVNGVLYFTADDGTHANELWKSDGTAGGTVMVKDINPGSGSSEASDLTDVNGILFFAADDGTHGRELWKSDGTAGGTVMVKDINPGSGSSEASGLTNVNGVLYFSADDGTHGKELWKSDGTEAGTVMVYDVNPGIGDGDPHFLTNVNGTLYFTAWDGTGAHVWKYTPDLPTNQPPVAGNFSLNAAQGGVALIDGWNFTDPNGDQAQSLKITSLPTHGTLFRDADGDNVIDGGEAVTANQVITWADAKTSHLVKYQPNGGYLGADTLQYVVTDTQGAEGTVAGTAHITVIAATNQPPVAGDFSLNAAEGGVALVDGWSFTDPNGDQAQSLKITSLPTHGTLFRDADGDNVIDGGEAVTANQVITWADAKTSHLVKYQPNGGYLGTDTVQYVVTDTQGAEGTVAGTATITVIAATNQPPVAGDFSLNAAEGGVALVDGWSFTDPNGDQAQSIKVTGLPAHGTLFRDVDGDNAIDGGEAVTANQVITWADAKTSHLVKYQPTSGYLGADTLHYVVTDTQGAEGTVAGTANITVFDAFNDPPVNTVPPAQIIPEDTILAFSSANGNRISISDPDAGTAAVQVQLTGAHGTITLAPFTGLTFSAGDGTADATMTFTGTIGAINTALDGMTFTPTADYNGLGGGVTILTNDLGNTGSDGAKVDTDTVLVTVTSVQDPPVAENFDLYVDKGTTATIDGWDFTDPDGDTAQSIRITTLPSHGTLFLDADHDNVIDPGETVTATANQPIAWDDATTSGLLKYQPIAAYDGFDTVQYLVTDSAGTVSTVAGVVSITVGDPFNDPPVNHVPGAQSTVQNTPLVFSTRHSNTISISDPDAGTADVQVRLTAANGTIDLAGTGGLSFSAGDGTADATMTFTGTISAINTALDGMIFTPTLNYAGTAASVTVTTNDQGHTGSDGAKTDTDIVAVTVVEPTNVPTAGDFTTVVYSATPNWPWVGWITGWNFSDPQGDAAGFVRITALPTHGTLFLDSNGNHRLDSGEEISVGQEISWSAVKSFQGVKYIGETSYDGLDSFRYVVIDDSGDVGTFQGTCTIGVGLNDPPVHHLPGNQSMPQGGSLVYSTANGNRITVSDSDVGTSNLEVNLYSYNGKLSLGSTAGVSMITGDGTNDWWMAFRAPLATVNTALDGLRFTPPSGYSGPAMIGIVTSDMGATGVGRWGIDMDFLPITVTRV